MPAVLGGDGEGPAAEILLGESARVAHGPHGLALPTGAFTGSPEDALDGATTVPTLPIGHVREQRRHFDTGVEVACSRD
ncbi:hypothetical protein ACFU6I_40420 [Streptomyces sp. NPDC057486]|uniref:hypothetical protein n=1 Tax=Streptomyces sp. NPDC057486 TaxID=3346145 RepID=UPI00368BD335